MCRGLFRNRNVRTRGISLRKSIEGGGGGWCSVVRVTKT